jgi:transcriptional regulator with XRE-family HTH domain
MDPAAWRKREGLSVRKAARRLGIRSPMSVLHYETGAREAPNSIVLAYERESAGTVTGADLHKVRQRYLRGQSKAA